MGWINIPERRVEPDLSNLLAILRREVPSRPTLFEFYLNEGLYKRVVPGPEPSDLFGRIRRSLFAFYRLGYDSSTVLIPGFSFTDKIKRRKKATISLNEVSVIRNRKEFDTFEWPDPEKAIYEILDQLGKEMPKGMKLIPYSPDGVLENVINLMGFEGLCLNIIEDPQLVQDVFEQVGTRLVQYYELAVKYESVGACISNDDWGFKTSTYLSPKDMRSLVFPWHKRIVEVVHAAGKPVILHSCGNFEKIIDDIINDMRFDGRHSYEDNILPVENAYEMFHDRIAIIGGIDVGFICQSGLEDVYRRSKAILERTAERGAYAHGTGNSVPEYVPDTNYFAMILAALDMR